MKVRFPQRGPVAQLGARLNGIQEVTGSIPVRSTISLGSLGRCWTIRSAGNAACGRDERFRLPSGCGRVVASRIAAPSAAAVFLDLAEPLTAFGEICYTS